MSRSNPSMVAWLRRFLRQEAGVALIEFWVVFPVIFVLALIGLEFGRFILIKQKLEKSTYMLLTILTQQQAATFDPTGSKVDNKGNAYIGIDETEINQNIFPHLLAGMHPFTIANGSTDRIGAFFTSLYRGPALPPNPPDPILVRWQQSYVAPGSIGGFEWRSGLTNLWVRGQKEKRKLCTPTCKAPEGLSQLISPFPLTSDEIANINGMVPGEGMLVVETYFYYRPLYKQLLTTVPEAAGGTGVGFAERRLSVRLYGMSRSDPLIYLPNYFPINATNPVY